MTVEELLIEEKIKFKQSPADFVVHCLNPEHDDTNPSMRIDKITGIYNCFSCGFKGNIFKLFDKPSNYLDIKREKVRQRIEEKRSATVGLKMPTDIMPYVGNEREIKPDTYKKFEAFMSSRSPFNDRIVFPIRDITGRIVAFQGRLRMNSHIKDQPKYIFYPPKAILPLYPTRVTPIKSRVILVEGIYDVVNLHDKGLTNSLCMFGVNNMNEQKLQLLKMTGVDQVDIILDPDEAGQKAAEKTQELCENVGLKHYNIRLPAEYGDPGDLTESMVIKLKEKLYG
jgi:DNA primase